jgi:hypothetical protein
MHRVIKNKAGKEVTAEQLEMEAESAGMRGPLSGMYVFMHICTYIYIYVCVYCVCVYIYIDIVVNFLE